MNDKEHINGKGRKSNVVDDKRRSFTKVGMAAPVIMTLTSKSVLANVCTISGIMSGNASDPNQVNCQGCLPDRWINPLVTQGQSYTAGAVTITKDTNFRDVFGTARSAADETMGNLLTANTTDLHAHAIAALLNAIFYDTSFGNTPDEIIAWCGDTSAIDDQELIDRYAVLNNRLCSL